MIMLARSQLRAALCDHKFDVAAGKRTIGTFVGKRNTPVKILQRTFSDRTCCSAQLRGPDPHSSRRAHLFAIARDRLRLVLLCWFAEGVLLVVEWKAYLIGLGYAALLVAWLTRALRIAQMYNITGAFCLWFIAFNWVSSGPRKFKNVYHNVHVPEGGHQTWW